MKEIQVSEYQISLLLKWGVYFCGAILTVGCLLSFLSPLAWEHGQTVIAQLRAGGDVENPLFYRSLAEVFSGFAHFDSLAWMVIGLGLLIALPIIRVAFTVWVFAIQKDRIYVLLSSTVLLILLLSAYLGKTI